MDRARRPGRGNGITLLECVVSSVMLGSAIVAGLGLLQVHEATYAIERMQGEGLFFLERELERVRGTDFGSLKTTAFTPVPEDATYSVRRVITAVNAVTIQITVELQWTTQSGVARVDRLVTLRCKGVN